MQQCPHPPWPCWGQCPSTPGAEDRIRPFSLWEGVGLSLCFPSNAHPSAPSWHLESSLWPQSCHPSMQPSSMQGPTVPTSLASPAARPPALCTSLPEDLDLPLGVLLLPHPQPLLAPLGCNTNPPVPAGHREPQNSPLYFGGVSPACPATSGLGAGKQHGGHSGSEGLGIAALLWAKSTRPFCISARHGQRVPALSPVMAAGAGDGGGAPQLQGNLIWVFIV